MPTSRPTAAAASYAFITASAFVAAEHRLGNHQRALFLLDELIRDNKPDRYFMPQVRKYRDEAAAAIRESAKRLDKKSP